MSSGDFEPERMPSSWHELQAPYFACACRSVLDVLMTERGFHLAGATNLHVVYALEERFLEYCYLVEDFPVYSLAVNLGLLGQCTDGRPQLQGVGLWRFLPRTDAHLDHARWAFTDEASLRRVVATIFDAVIEPIALPVLGDPERLAAAMDAQRCELESAHTQALESDCLARARRSFAAKQYAEAVRWYEELDHRRLVASDCRRLELARQRATKSRD